MHGDLYVYLSANYRYGHDVLARRYYARLLPDGAFEFDPIGSLVWNADGNTEPRNVWRIATEEGEPLEIDGHYVEPPSDVLIRLNKLRPQYAYDNLQGCNGPSPERLASMRPYGIKEAYHDASRRLEQMIADGAPAESQQTQRALVEQLSRYTSDGRLIPPGSTACIYCGGHHTPMSGCIRKGNGE